MIRIFPLLLFALHLNLSAVDFVLFTQPKTATHLLSPILSELTHRELYWAPEFTKRSKPFEGDLEEILCNPDSIVFSLGKAPWSLEMMNRVWQINKEKGTFLHLHAPYSLRMEQFLRAHNCITFFIKRDPRDQIVSLLNHYKYIHFNEAAVKELKTDEERLIYMVRNRLRSHTIHYMNWINSPVCCALDFNKLMGSHGGVATDADSMEQMRMIADALEVEISDSELAAIYHKHFGHSWNFFRGKAEAWKEYFTDELKAVVKEEIGDLLINLGYEEDLEW